MANPIFNALGAASNNRNPMQMLSMLKSNPLGVLRQAGFNVPNDVSNPQAIIQYLMDSGQVSQTQLDQAQRMAKNFGVG